MEYTHARLSVMVENGARNCWLLSFDIGLKGHQYDWNNKQLPMRVENNNYCSLVSVVVLR